MFTVKRLSAEYYTPRTIKVKLGIIHHTGTLSDLSNYLSKPTDRLVSVHFHINRQGEITEYSNLIGLAPGKGWAKQAWHTGVSKWKLNGQQPLIGLNSHSVGIELAGDGNRWDFTEAQYLALAQLLPTIVRAFPQLDHPNAWVGHQHLTPPRDWYPNRLYESPATELVRNHKYYQSHVGRKPDPGQRFDWARFYQFFQSDAHHPPGNEPPNRKP